MRVSQQVKDETRRALLDAAAVAFAREGFHRASIDGVSESAGLAKGTVYNYFDSKRAIFEAVLLQACRLAADSADAVPDSACTRRRLEAFVEGNLAWGRRHPPLARLLARELLGGDAATRELVLSASAPCLAKVAAILADGAARGELRASGPVDELALTFVVLANALLLQALRPSSAWPALQTLAPTVADLFMHGVARGGDGDAVA